MKCYLLWRDNQESGPYTPGQLSALGLRTFDLLRPEENNAFWSYPSQMEEFKDMIQPYMEAGSSVSAFRAHKIPLSSWLSGGIFFLITGMIWIKWMVSSPDMSAAHAMQSGAGHVRGLPEDATPERSTDQSYQNALIVEIVPVDTSQETMPAGKAVSRADLMKQVQLKGTSRKAGVYGEFADLKLSVYNTSSLLLEKVIIKVEFTRPGGKAIKTEKYVLYDLLPKGIRTLTIPLGKKDIKVKYEVMDIEPKEYKPVLVLA